MPIEQQTRLQRLGGMVGGAMSQAAPMLGGLGAGLAGNLPQYQMAQQQIAESQQLMQQREQAQRALEQQSQRDAANERDAMMAQTAQAALGFAKAGDFTTLAQMGMQLLDRAKRNGEPLQELQQLEILARMASNGSDEAAQRLTGILETQVNIGMATGLIASPQEEEYTLSEGQTRFRGGAPIAAIPKNQSPEEFTLSPGQTRFRNGVPIAAIPESASADSRPNARELEIQDIMSNFNVDRPEAIRILMEKTIVDPVSGNVMAYNPITQSGQRVEMGIPSTEVTLGTPVSASVEDLAFDPAKGTGFASSFMGLYNSTLGQIPILPISTSRSDAAQNLIILERDAINALATSSRPAVVEQERILRALPQAMDWFENPREAQNKTVQFIDLMTNQYVDDMRYQSNAQNPRGLREESGRRARAIEGIINRVLTPDAAQQMFQSINRVEQSIGPIIQMTNEQLMNVDPSTLDDAALDAYMERLKNAGR